MVTFNKYNELYILSTNRQGVDTQLGCLVYLNLSYFKAIRSNQTTTLERSENSGSANTPLRP